MAALEEKINVSNEDGDRIYNPRSVVKALQNGKLWLRIRNYKKF
ncbi:hypothetical protein [Clostridium sp. BL-8]|nr:hypothetical protein [Clostridium sp. BL-8]